MADIVRVIAIGGTLGALLAGSLAVPEVVGAFAAEPMAEASKSIGDLFDTAPKFDPTRLRKWDISVGPGVSTDVQRTTTISKIEHGHRTYVTIATTPTGTYSTDALTSPYVRYPGIDVEPRHRGHFYYSYGSYSSRFGTSTWSSYSSGSITYYYHSSTATRL